MSKFTQLIVQMSRTFAFPAQDLIFTAEIAESAEKNNYLAGCARVKIKLKKTYWYHTIADRSSAVSACG